ncbi:MAG TPA: FAA hydrolase family protein [Rhodobacteraceae bacterium]|nr:FAA hydrolase family protein [Paracoccaceae bacterium]
MVEFALPAPATPSVAITGNDARFPVRRIFCVGRNYAEHAREMGHDPNREPPFFFTKPADAVVDDGATLPYPPHTENLHHEAELVVAIGTGGTDIEVADALSHVWGYGVGNDLTRRDMQAKAKEMRRPWDMAKGFDNSAVCGPLHPVSAIGHPTKGRITAHVDGQLRQDGDIADMIWPVADVIAFLSGLVTLAAGDLIYTGTPAGVGPIARGQSCTITIEGLGSVTSTHV